jgi:hypothetical protein
MLQCSIVGKKAIIIGKQEVCQVQENNTKNIFAKILDMGQNFVVKFWRLNSCQKDNDWA